MSAADSTSDLRTVGTTQEIVNADGRRGSFAPVVVSREVAYCVAVLDGPADHAHQLPWPSRHWSTESGPHCNGSAPAPASATRRCR